MERRTGRISYRRARRAGMGTLIIAMAIGGLLSAAPAVADNPTSVAVDCFPQGLAPGTEGDIPPGALATCRATVTDTGTPGSFPPGTVSFSASTTDGAPVFSNPGSSCTLFQSGPASGMCQVTFTASQAEIKYTITGTYLGNPGTHTANSGTDTVLVNRRDVNIDLFCPVGYVSSPVLCSGFVGDGDDQTGTATRSQPEGTLTLSSNAGTFSGNPCPLTPAGPNGAACNVTFTPSGAGGTLRARFVSSNGVHRSKYSAPIANNAVKRPSETLFGSQVSLSCATSVSVAGSGSCVVVVRDFTGDPAAPSPSGFVGFTATPRLTLNNSSCQLSPMTPPTPTGDASSSCTVSYTGVSPGSASVKAYYKGNAVHAPAALNTLNVTVG